MASLRAEDVAVTAAIAADETGRHTFLSTNGCDYFRVLCLPASAEEAESLEGSHVGAPITYDQLVATYKGAVVLVPINDLPPSCQ